MTNRNHNLLSSFFILWSSTDCHPIPPPAIQSSTNSTLYNTLIAYLRWVVKLKLVPQLLSTCPRWIDGSFTWEDVSRTRGYQRMGCILFVGKWKERNVTWSNDWFVVKMLQQWIKRFKVQSDLSRVKFCGHSVCCFVIYEWSINSELPDNIDNCL